MVLLFANVSHAEQTDIINKLTQILSTINESKELKEKTADGDKQEPRSATEQISEIVNSSEKFISDNIPTFAGTDQIINDTSTMRDPFNLASTAAGQNAGGFSFGSSFLPTNNTKIPELKLRGVIYPKSKRPEDQLALLEIDNKEVYMVKIGDEISYDPRNPNAAIKIVNISRLHVTVQAGSLGNVLVVR